MFSRTLSDHEYLQVLCSRGQLSALQCCHGLGLLEDVIATSRKDNDLSITTMVTKVVQEVKTATTGSEQTCLTR